MTSFPSTYKGTCALCWETVYPNDQIVTAKVEAMGDTFDRNVHVECARSYNESSPPDLQLEIVAPR